MIRNMDKKKESKKIQKQINKLEKLLIKMEIRPCRGDKDIIQKEIDVENLKDQILSLKKEYDVYFYTQSKTAPDYQM